MSAIRNNRQSTSSSTGVENQSGGTQLNRVEQSGNTDVPSRSNTIGFPAIRQQVDFSNNADAGPSRLQSRNPYREIRQAQSQNTQERNWWDDEIDFVPLGVLQEDKSFTLNGLDELDESYAAKLRKGVNGVQVPPPGTPTDLEVIGRLNTCVQQLSAELGLVDGLIPPNDDLKNRSMDDVMSKLSQALGKGPLPTPLPMNQSRSLTDEQADRLCEFLDAIPQLRKDDKLNQDVQAAAISIARLVTCARPPIDDVQANKLLAAGLRMLMHNGGPNDSISHAEHKRSIFSEAPGVGRAWMRRLTTEAPDAVKAGTLYLHTIGGALAAPVIAAGDLAKRKFTAKKNISTATSLISDQLRQITTTWIGTNVFDAALNLVNNRVLPHNNEHTKEFLHVLVKKSNGGQSALCSPVRDTIDPDKGAKLSKSQREMGIKPRGLK